MTIKIKFCEFNIFQSGQVGFKKKNEQLNAYEFKWNDSKIKFPKAFVEAYPDATTHWINRENYTDFITGIL